MVAARLSGLRVVTDVIPARDDGQTLSEGGCKGRTQRACQRAHGVAPGGGFEEGSGMTETTIRPTDAEIWDWLDAVPDPEIPVISVVDLGIVRSVDWEGDMLTVSVTPTYSGCPATSIIRADIETALRDKGIERLTIRTQIAPAWTTDWLTDKGRAAMEAYGIAPPSPAAGPERCPHCGGTELEKLSQFGSTPCKAQWRCRGCLEPFDYFKCL